MLDLVQRHRVRLAIGLLIVVGIGVLAFLFLPPDLLPLRDARPLPTVHPLAPLAVGGGPPATARPTPARTVTPLPAAIKVYITGAVLHPGVYPAIDGDRIEDIIRRAGGATADADLDGINLAARVHDEEQIRVPRRGEATATAAAPAGVAPPAVASPAAGSTEPAPHSININTAGAADLDALPGIGPALAARIVAYREAHGPFAQPADIQQVSGIGPAIYAEIAPYITVGP